MNKKKVIRMVVVIAVAVILTAFSIGFYLFNKPTRDVAAAQPDFSISATDLVTEYLESPASANQKYLAEDGESKILAVTGKAEFITTDLNNQFVVTLRDETQNAGVSCTFTTSTNSQAEPISVGQVITIKGVIRSGAGYNEDLGLYEDVIMEKCSINNRSTD